MVQVISATALQAYRESRGGARRSRRSEVSPEAFLVKAGALLDRARAERQRGQGDEAFEFAYRCALRVAGAVIASSPVGKRRRLPTGAWARLRLVDVRGGDWADEFEAFSRLRSRLNSGLESGVEERVVDSLLALASEFLDEVEAAVESAIAAA
ncbi:SAV_6107 family HEPN domain-containing protein [Corynebacterium lowii]|uniref:SAV-6107-like HEPN domain-containing protein n=1 Tax=Corynebacterium lowii TaxID=1544413 RepID=A0A0Q0U455_9CORY|nr:SAV_6107 family HEPN domain-containing protein [Corynebacterium lowii]KQB86768.1 hypothetical protein Clow_00976 [Corynebacterium lowii]MDP9851454.1 hypothetical protein [Corynebacterium lowii]